MSTQRCHGRVIAGLVGCTALVLAVTTTGTAQAHGRDAARQTLPAGDGWASATTGTTGGAAAKRVYTVTTWAQFKAALAESGTAPRIIKVKGVLDADGADCSEFAVDGYDFDRYLADYDPAVWGYEEDLEGEKATAGTQEYLRNQSAAAQAKAIKAAVPANTTIIGVGRDAGIVGGSLQINGVDNVIVRGLTLESPLDCFPQWDPTDGSTGNWNSEYDAAVVYNATHVWLDHNTFTDGDHPDSTLPSYYGRIYQQHDGELDVVRGADYVTASWNVFEDHDKTLMIGNSDSAGATDEGKLRVTLHHNLFRNLVERAPRVRFGQVDAYNNSYVANGDFGYAFGVGFKSQLVAEKNAFTLPRGIGAGAVLYRWSDFPVTGEGNVVNGVRTDLVAAYNTANPATPLASGAGWKPVLRAQVDPAKVVTRVVGRGAGADQLR
ncbi:polysaccharide lyase family 1 protein [Streptomyces kunmingensis]|uniref:Polysaccharide lyase family 1 protein n=1 Tax=Streptomyces kunmingensis TaxID=68225 RepID=A0ABU6CRB4_9ACTN|nr:polysaccharide lyase family 1 protein [Streptomyces kunmingensis]MEB3967188.1 polysaccharide lyase family 1 protein [Streptomyces kunmingensis]